MSADRLEPDRRDPRQRALRHLLQQQAEYGADRWRRDPGPVGPGSAIVRAVARMSQAVAMLRIAPVNGDPGDPVAYAPRWINAAGRGLDVFDADEFAPRVVADPYAALRGIDPDPVSGDQGADVFDADYFARQNGAGQ